MASIECCQLMTIAETAKKTGPSIKSPIANLLPKTSEATSFETPTFLSCQVGRNSCKAVFHGAPWNFKSDSQSTFPGKLIFIFFSILILHYHIHMLPKCFLYLSSVCYSGRWYYNAEMNYNSFAYSYMRNLNVWILYSVSRVNDSTFILTGKKEMNYSCRVARHCSPDTWKVNRLSFTRL